MAAPLFAPQARRPIPLALQINSMSTLAVGSPVNEKDMLPCILITPSTPVHDTDFEIHYFTAPEKSQRSFFANVWNLFSLAPPTHRIRLPDSPDAYPYGPTSRSTGWSAAKRLRTFLLLFGMLFVALHLFLVPHHGEQGVFDLLHTAHRHSDDTYSPALDWAGWTQPPEATSRNPDDHMDSYLIDEDDLVPTSTVEDAQVTITSTATNTVPTEQ